MDAAIIDDLNTHPSLGIALNDAALALETLANRPLPDFTTYNRHLVEALIDGGQERARMLLESERVANCVLDEHFSQDVGAMDARTIVVLAEKVFILQSTLFSVAKQRELGYARSVDVDELIVCMRNITSVLSATKPSPPQQTTVAKGLPELLAPLKNVAIRAGRVVVRELYPRTQHFLFFLYKLAAFLYPFFHAGFTIASHFNQVSRDASAWANVGSGFVTGIVGETLYDRIVSPIPWSTRLFFSSYEREPTNYGFTWVTQIASGLENFLATYQYNMALSLGYMIRAGGAWAFAQLLYRRYLDWQDRRTIERIETSPEYQERHTIIYQTIEVLARRDEARQREQAPIQRLAIEAPPSSPTNQAQRAFARAVPLPEYSVQ